MLGRLFGRKKSVFGSESEALAAFLLAQFFPEYQWQLSEAELNEIVGEAGPEFAGVTRMWVLIYCAWLFRHAVIYRHDEQFFKNVMRELRVRIAKADPQKADLTDLPRYLEFWFAKLDGSVGHLKEHPTVGGKQLPVTYPAALTFIVLDEGSPWHMKQDTPDALILNVTFALSKLHERMQPAMLRLIEGIEKQEAKG
jgi:hypothetical protein